jgi:hypothetical protein
LSTVDVSRGLAESTGNMSTNLEDVQKSWEKLLTPETLRGNLLRASLFISAFELLKTAIIERIQSFFTFDYIDGQPQLDARYQEVTQLHSRLLQASCLWLAQNGAITADDMEMLNAIRTHRNELAHELPHFLSDANRNIDMRRFENIRYLLRKIETWWIKEIEIPTNPDFDGVEVPEEDIQPGSVIMLDFIIKIALEQDQ